MLIGEEKADQLGIKCSNNSIMFSGFLFASYVSELMLKNTANQNIKKNRRKKISKRSLLFLVKGPESNNLTKQKSLDNKHSTQAKYHRKKKKSMFKYPSTPAKAEWVESLDRLLPVKDCMEVPSPPLLQALCQKRPRRKLECSFLMPWL